MRTLPYHYPFLVHEFGDTAFVVRSDGEVIAYLFGFVATAEPVGYIHLVGVRSAHQGTGLGRSLYEHFADVARERGCTHLRAVTAPFNTDSQAFHAALGFQATGHQRRRRVCRSTPTTTAPVKT
jgi:GNAT superfamily N-acetyltransferase